MFGSQAIELFIAIVTMLFVVSLASSTIVEAVGAMGHRRGRQLEAAITRLLGLEAPPTPVGAEDAEGEDAEEPEDGEDGEPAPPPEQLVRMSTTVAAVQSKPGRFPSAMSEETFLSLAREVGTLPGATEAAQLNALAPDEDLLRRFRESMDRLSSAFQRRTKLWLFVCGLAIAVCGNVSVYRITQTLWGDDAAREAVVEAAANVGEDEDGLDPAELDSIGSTVEHLEDLSMPVGWSDDAKDAWGDGWNTGRIGILFGWIATAALVTLGAPFWFDLLTKALPRKFGATQPPPQPPAPPATPPPTSPTGGT